jgi:hypothetical protein
MECYTVADLSAELNESVDLPLSNQSIAAVAELKGKNSDGASCRFRKLDSRVSMMEPTKDRVCNNISEPLNRACVGRVLPERNMSSYVIIIGDVFR